MKVIIAALVIFQVFSLFSLAQNREIKFNLLEGNNGESLGNINGITQDSYGFMWFTGQRNRCLYRYDGYRMSSFRHDSLDNNSLGGDLLETVYADTNGKVWIGFYDGGLDLYEPHAGIFKHFRNSPKDPASLSPGMVSVIMRDREGNLWVGTQNGLDRLDEKKNHFIHYRNERDNSFSLSSNFVRAIYEDRKGVLWIGTGFPFDLLNPEEGGLNRMEKNGNFTRFMHDPANPNTLVNNKVRSILEDSRGIFWIGTADNGIQTMDRQTGIIRRYIYDPAHTDRLGLPPAKSGNPYEHVTFICEDSNHCIWIGTCFSGINHYDPASRKLTHFESSNGFPDKGVWMGYVSRDGVFWLASQELTPNTYRVDPTPKPIQNVTTGYRTYSFHQDKNGMLWVGTMTGGLRQFDAEKTLKHIFIGNKNDSIDLSGVFVYSVLDYERDSLLLGTGSGLFVLDKISGRLSRFLPASNSGISLITEVYDIIRDDHKNLWFASINGLIYYDTKKGNFTKYLSEITDSANLTFNGISCVLQDGSGNIWAGTTGYYNRSGVFQLNRQTGGFKNYLNGMNVHRLYEDKEAVMWAGTDKGLYRFDNKKKDFDAYFDSNSNLGNSIVNGMTEDDSGNLWISTQSAIVEISSNRNKYFALGKSYGIQPNDLIQAGIYKTVKGEILVGNNNGFYFIDPNEISTEVKSFNIIITGMLINNSLDPGIDKNISGTSIEDMKEIKLKYNQNNISFQFAADDHRSVESVKYYTMLENYDNTWRVASGDKSAAFIKVEPGKYNFKIKAFNVDGLMAEKTIQIIIEPPWWKTWWAYGTYALLLIVFSFAMNRFLRERAISFERQRAQVKELAQAKAIEKAYSELKNAQAQLIQAEKMASLGELTAGIAHEIQNPLNFVNNFSDVNRELLIEMKEELDKGNMTEAKVIAKDVIDNEEKISHHGRRADAIVKGMLQHSRTSSGQKEPADINALANEYLQLSHHGLRARDKTFHVTIQTDFNENTGRINIVPQDIGRVLLNLYNNAFYAVTEKKKQIPDAFEPLVNVSTKRLNDKLEIRIKDNGKGIPSKVMDKIFQPFFTTKPAGEGTGLGLSLSYDIVKAHGGEIRVESIETEGSTFIVVLPV